MQVYFIEGGQEKARDSVSRRDPFLPVVQSSLAGSFLRCAAKASLMLVSLGVASLSHAADSGSKSAPATGSAAGSVTGTKAGWTAEFREATQAYEKLLMKHVAAQGEVDYQGFERDQAKLKSYLSQFETLDLSKADDDSKKAALINFYNAGMIINILRYAKAEKIPVSSKAFTQIKVNDIRVPGGNIWNGSYTFALAGTQATLDDIEHGYVRADKKVKIKAFQVKVLDARIHAAVNCAAMSCPRLRREAYTPENIDSLLQENMIEYMSSDFYFRKKTEDTLIGNSIVEWYRKDFDKAAEAQPKVYPTKGHYLASFVSDKSKNAVWKRKMLIDKYAGLGLFGSVLGASGLDFVYDWTINDQRNASLRKYDRF